MRAPPPRTLGRYVVLGEGEGEAREEQRGEADGARSLLAYDPALGRKIALRLLPQGDPAADALLEAARRQGRLLHPGVRAVRDSGVSDAGLFLALEHAEGTLQRWLAAAPRRTGAILDQFILVAEALGAAHAAGLCHGRLDAGAVLLGADGRPRLDGLRAAAPGDGDAREDQRALCAALAAALAGRRLRRRLRRALQRGQHPEAARRFPDVAALCAALRDAAAPGPARWLALGAGLLLLAVAPGLGRGPAAPCGGTEPRLGALLREERRAARRAAFLRSGRPDAAEALAQVEAALHAFPARWAAEDRAACEEGRRGSPGAAADAVDTADLRRGCLRRVLDEVEALAEVLGTAEPAVVARAAQASRELTDLAACRDLPLLRLQQPPRDPEGRPAVVELRARLLRHRVLLSAGARREALRLAEASVTEAERLGFPPLLVDALVRAGQARLSLRDPRGAEPLLRRAIDIGERARYDTSVAVALEMLMHVADLDDAQPEMDDTERWAAAAIERCDACTPLWANWHRKRGNARFSQGRYREAAKEYELALPSYDAPKMGSLDLHNNLGMTYLQLGDLRQAMERLQRSLRLREETLGRAHASVAPPLDNLAEALDRLGRFPDSLRAAERMIGIARSDWAGAAHGLALVTRGRARCRLGRGEQGLADLARGVEVLERALGLAHPDLAAALTTWGDALRRAGRAREALPLLDRALGIAQRRAHPNQGAALATRGLARLALHDAGGADDLTIALGPGAPWVLAPALEAAACVGLARAQPAARRQEARALLRRALERHAAIEASGAGGAGYEAERDEARAMLAALER